MCQNAFLPVDVITFWAVQMFSVCLPTVCFMTYMVHKIGAVEDARKIKEKKEAQLKRKEQLRIQSEREWLEEVQAELHPDKIDDNAQIQEIEQELSDLQNQLEDMDEREKIEEKLAAEGIKATSAMEQHELTPPKLMLGYFLMVLFRSLVEIGFLYWYFQMYVFDLVMPKEYRCNASPCLSATTCFVGRATEKTWVLHIMFILACFTLACSLVELFRLGISKPYAAFQNRHKDISKNPEYMPANAQNHIPTFAA